jgi:hypothetical protein
LNLSYIDHLELYVEREVTYKDGSTKIKRVLLEGDLEIGETAYFKNSYRNKVVKLGDLDYMFYRFDEVQTHVQNKITTYSIDDIRKNINKQLNYNIKYADDRVILVDRLISENTWLYELVSSNKMMIKEQKKKNSFLAENQAYDLAIDAISSYINHAKFKNKEDEEYHLKLQQEKLKLEQKDKRKKTTEEFEQLSEIIDEIQGFHHKQVKKSFDSNQKPEFASHLSNREHKGDFAYQEEMKDRAKKVKFLYKREEIPADYWSKMYPQHRKELIPFYDNDLHNEKDNKSIVHNELRPVLLNQMKVEIERLHKYLGLDLNDSVLRKKHADNLRVELGERQYRVIRKMYTELKSDYELSKKRLTDEFYFDPAKHSTVYEINSDTWYENENGDLFELSKNNVQMSKADTYKGLILNYKDLKDKYTDKQDSDWWALVKDFEVILANSEFTEEEQFVLDILFDGYSQKQIRERYAELDLGELSTYRISNMINSGIPNKLLSTYLDSVQDWLVVNHQIGKYKVCNKCEEPKLSNERYFYKKEDNKDGLHSACRDCMTKS